VHVNTYLSLGAGVQSSTLALMAAHGEVTPMPDAAIFADTQDEPASVYEWLDWLEGELPFPVWRVTKGRLSDAALVMHETSDGRLFSKLDIPFFCKNADGSSSRITRRTCTRAFKVLPLVKRMRESVGSGVLHRWRSTYRSELDAIKESRRLKRPLPLDAWRVCQANALVVQWIGISLDEASRMKESRDPWIRSEWPLIDARMTRHACKVWMSEHGYREPPRSACVYCPFRDNNSWRDLRDNDPQAWRDAISFESARPAAQHRDNGGAMPYLHRSLVPLAEVDLSTDQDRGQLLLWGNECEGMCGV
jgi:hypothetical protein